MITKIFKIGFLCGLIGFISCTDDNENFPRKDFDQTEVNKLSEEMVKVRDYVPQNAIVGHRGTSYWTPESTEAAYRWARNAGADYLEADLQITKDGIILVMHDDNMTRTTNISEVYPDRKNDPANTFTYEELMKLDAGTWFNKDYPSRARDSYDPSKGGQKQYISTLEDLIMFAQGQKIKRNSNGERVFSKTGEGNNTKYVFDYEDDELDNENRPGIYVETKEPHLNPDLEQKLYQELDKLGWNIISKPAPDNEPFYKNGKINVGNTNGKVVLQTFSHASLDILSNLFQGKVPTCLLLWMGKGKDDMPDGGADSYAKFINLGLDKKAQFVGPSISGGTPPDNWDDLLKPEQASLIRKSGMGIHPYTFETEDQMNRYYKGTGNDRYKAPYCDGMFTNLPDITIRFYEREGKREGAPAAIDAQELLKQLGY